MQISSLRCLRHPEREAVARCPGCGGYFCRECVTEHDGAVLCAQCIAKAAAAGKTAKSGGKRFGAAAIRRAAAALGRIAASLFIMLLLWVAYGIFGAIIRAIPTRFHTVEFF